MVLARAGNWEMKNIFYYLTNHLNNSQRFCSEFRGSPACRGPIVPCSLATPMVNKCAGVGLRAAFVARICVSRKG